MLKTVLFAFLVTVVHTGPADFLKEPIIQICYANNLADKVDQVRILFDEFTECYPRMMHLEEVPAEFDESRRNGTVDEVARKYCGKAAQTKFCMAKINHAVDLCTKGDQEIIPVRIIINNLNRIIDYGCYEKDNITRLARFVDDGGVRCFVSRSKDLVRCVKITRAGMQADFENMLVCMMDELKKCSASAALDAQGILEYIRDDHHSNDKTQYKNS